MTEDTTPPVPSKPVVEPVQCYGRQRKCRRPKCNGDMLPGVAMGQTFTGMADFPGREVVTMSPGGPGVIVQCLKCNRCGYSVSA